MRNGHFIIKLEPVKFSVNINVSDASEMNIAVNKVGDMNN